MQLEKRATLAILPRMRLAGVLTFALTSLMLSTSAWAQAPKPEVVESPNVKVLTGLYAQQFQEEMNLIVQGLGVTCNTCHVPRNFAAEDKPIKQKARQMLEMVKALNKQYFPDYKPKEGESVLGKVTCYTCHKGEQLPKTSVGAH
jgi:hypothetical protein